MVRYKSRYLLFQILYPECQSTSPHPNCPTHLDFCSPSDPSITPQHLATLIRDTISTHFGDWGSGLTASLAVKYFSPVTSTGILRCSRDHHKLVWAALTFVSSVLSRPCVIRVLRVSGTIKKAETECIRRGKQEIIKCQELQMKQAQSDLAAEGAGDDGGDGDGSAMDES